MDGGGVTECGFDVLYRGEPPHECLTFGYANPRTVVRCHKCGRAWWFDGFPYTRFWRRVRWWNFRLRKAAGL